MAAQLLGAHLHPPLLALILREADIDVDHAVVSAWQLRQFVSIREFLETNRNGSRKTQWRLFCYALAI